MNKAILEQTVGHFGKHSLDLLTRASANWVWCKKKQKKYCEHLQRKLHLFFVFHMFAFIAARHL